MKIVHIFAELHYKFCCNEFAVTVKFQINLNKNCSSICIKKALYDYITQNDVAI